jgi:hypothetical protein
MMSLRSIGACLALVVACGCQPRTPSRLVVVRGDRQVGKPAEVRPIPLTVQVLDGEGQPVSDVSVQWSRVRGEGQISPGQVKTGADGTSAAQVTLGPEGPNNIEVYAATAGLSGSPVFFNVGSGGLMYFDPPLGGKIRLVRNTRSNRQKVWLDLVAATELVGFTVGLNVPLQGGLVALENFLHGQVLPAGSNPIAARALIPPTGPLKGILVTAQSQKAAGAGALNSDSSLGAGAVFYTLVLGPIPGASAGVVFDGAGSPPGVRAGLLDLAGNEQVGAQDFALGRLEYR